MNYSTQLQNTFFYNSVDSIEKLKLRILLKQVANGNSPLIDDPEFNAFYDTNSLLLPLETFVVKWQEKVTCSYNTVPEALSESSSSKASKSILNVNKTAPVFYTIVDGDSSIDALELNDIILNTPSRKQPNNHLSDQILWKRNHQKSQQASKSRRFENESNKYVINSSDSVRNLEFPFREMHVMASFLITDSSKSDTSIDKENIKSNQNSNIQKRVEKRLLTVRLHQNGLLSLTPNVTKSNECYRIEISDQVFDFRIENVSEPLTNADEKLEFKIYTEFYGKRAESTIKSISEMNFESVADPFSLYLNIFGEIVSCTEFQGSPLYIKYHIEFPENWDTKGKQIISGKTQSAHGILNSKNVYTSNFCHPIELEILSNQEDQPNRWPVLYFRVFSHDKWDRHVVEGYGFAEIPSKAGNFEIDIPTWRPLGNRLSRLRMYYFGGSPEIEDLQFLRSLYEKKYVNRYGFEVETCGSIKLKLNIAHQAQSNVRIEKKIDSDKKGDYFAITSALMRAKNRLKSLKTAGNK